MREEGGVRENKIKRERERERERELQSYNEHQVYYISAWYMYMYLNWWISTFDVETHSRRWSIVEEHDTSEEVSGITQGPTGTPNHLHCVVL